MIRRLSVSILAAAAAACGSGPPEATPERAAPPMRGIEVTREALPLTVPAHGSVRAQRRADISTRIIARVTAVPVDIGSAVREGDLLVRLGTDDVAAKRASAEAAVRAAQAARDEAARQAARLDTLYARDAVAMVQRDGARLALTQTESQLAMAQAALQEVAAAETYSVITAPFDGTITARRVSVGDLAAPGMPLLEIAGTGPREGVLAVTADVAAAVSPGTVIDATLPDGRGTRGTVRAVAAGADPATRTVEVLVNLPADWPTGVALSGWIPAGTRDGVAVPATAIVRRGQLTGVQVITPEGVGVRWVRLGRTLPATPSAEGQSAPRVEVLSGLEPGERILP